MAIQKTTNLTNSIRTQYISEYLKGVMLNRVYDQISVPYTEFAAGMSMSELMSGSSIQVNFLSDMTPGVTAISEDADVTPQILRDAIASVTPTSRGEALQWSENTDIQAYTDYGAGRYRAVGVNMIESVELLAQAPATQGTWAYWNSTHTTRATQDAGTAGDLATDAVFRKMHSKMLALKVPGFINEAGEANTFAAIMTPEVFHDIAESGNVNDIGLYQQAGIHLNFELGKIGPFRLVVTPYAKVFYGAGADNASAVATTLSVAANALATQITVASSTNITAGEWLNIGTEETGDTHYATNERVKLATDCGSGVLDIVGEAPNGGLRFDHAAGTAVRNADSVYPIVFGGPQSLVKVFADDENSGPYGKTVGPKKTGRLDQWASLGWKFYGNYGRVSENRLLRAEFATSHEA